MIPNYILVLPNFSVEGIRLGPRPGVEILCLADEAIQIAKSNGRAEVSFIHEGVSVMVDRESNTDNIVAEWKRNRARLNQVHDEAEPIKRPYEF